MDGQSAISLSLGGLSLQRTGKQKNIDFGSGYTQVVSYGERSFQEIHKENDQVKRIHIFPESGQSQKNGGVKYKETRQLPFRGAFDRC